jgi:NaMN:DMB phosphoribosyltransferase
VGDPAQPALAGIAVGASRGGAVLLAGGTQMLAVTALAERLARELAEPWQPERVLVGTTRWVAADPTASAARLAELLGAVPLVAGDLDFTASRIAGLRAYERGYVKEGVGAGGLIVAAHLAGISHDRLRAAVEAVCDRMHVDRV